MHRIEIKFNDDGTAMAKWTDGTNHRHDLLFSWNAVRDWFDDWRPRGKQKDENLNSQNLEGE